MSPANVLVSNEGAIDGPSDKGLDFAAAKSGSDPAGRKRCAAAALNLLVSGLGLVGRPGTVPSLPPKEPQHDHHNQIP